MNDRTALSSEFSRAFARLREGTAEDPAKSDLIIDGVIQRFEFTKEAAAIGMVANGAGWIGMLEAKNRTAHLEETARRSLRD